MVLSTVKKGPPEQLFVPIEAVPGRHPGIRCRIHWYVTPVSTLYTIIESAVLVLK